MAKRGVFLPAFDALADAAVIASLAADAERAGWDGFFLWDHLAYAPPVVSIADPWVCLTAAALSTTRITLGPMVTPLSRRRPTVLAKQAVTLDRLSRGRLVLGFGLGDDGAAREMSRFGEEADPVRRAAVLDEGLAVLQDLLSGQRVDHDGAHHTVHGRFLPGPWRASGIPMWLAARWPNDRPLRRASHYDGAFAIGVDHAEQAQQLVARLAALRGALNDFDVVIDLPDGTDPAPLTAVAGVTWLLTRFGPYEMDLNTVRAHIATGPR
jgi:alkanesulfonate monooxygenase SsuD/methylene tetrahydromethanopterin reductase-like flavin-dependent oxidoreductase (luciferase family)